MGPFVVTRCRDLLKPGFDSGEADNRPKLPVSGSPMLTLFFENGAVFTLRGSGTEPKLKYYADLPGPLGDETDKTLNNMIDAMVEQFIQPHFASGILKARGV